MNHSHQSHHSRTGLTSHLFYAYDAFSSFYFSFFYVPSLTMMTNLTNQTVMDQGHLCAVYVYSDCPRMNQSHQSHHSRTGLTSHLLYACDAFSYLYVSFFYFLSLMIKNLTNQMVADQGLSSLSVRAFRTSVLNYVLIESFLFESEYHQYFRAPRYFPFSVCLFESYLVESQFLKYFPARYVPALTF